ncbi:MAG: hypothetical protein ACLU1U_03485 [Lachnospiraceae bacterium]
MKKNTRKTRTLALTLALCLALVCFAPAALVCASTDLEPPEVFPYEQVYYFSDGYIGEVDANFATISSELTVRYLNVPYLHKCPYSLTESDYSPYRFEVEKLRRHFEKRRGEKDTTRSSRRMIPLATCFHPGGATAAR